MLINIICKRNLFRKKFTSFLIFRNKRQFSSETNFENEKNDNSIKGTQNSEPIISTFESIKSSICGQNISQLLRDSSPEQKIDRKDHILTNSQSFIARRDQTRLSVKPKTPPEDTTVILFPGQGSQFVGMGMNVIDVPNVRQMFTIAKQILGYDLLNLCLNGPVDSLNRTEYSQPAIYVCSLAAVEKLRHSGSGHVEACISTAGFSVGEIAALVFSGSMSFEDGLRLVKIRAESMQLASQIVPSAMITVFFNADAKIKFACFAAKEWCVRKGIEPEYAVCSVANYLFPHCKVIAGHEEAISFLESNSKDFGIRRIKRLPVSGAFHTKLMNPAKEVVREALKHIKLEIPLIPCHSNFDARIYRDVESMKKNLANQICSPVHWEQILHNIYDREKDTKCPKTFECGPGSALLSTLAMVHGIARRSAQYVSV